MAPSIPAITMFLLALAFIPCITFAASGGRMGGNSFSKRSSSSHSSHFSPPSNHHYHNHYYNRPYFYRSRTNGYSSSVYHNEMKKGEGIEHGGSSGSDGFVVAVFVVGSFLLVVYYFEYVQNRGSVLMVQVGLTGKGRPLLKELNEIAETTDTSSPEGWQHILTETTLALLHRPQYFISGYSSVKQHYNVDSVEKCFSELSSDEREKIDVESLVNVNNIKRHREVIPQANKIGKDFIVVTVLVAAKGSHKLPTIRSVDDMKNALRSLHTGFSNLLSVEVLWTPQDENDSLSEDEMLENYPLLRPI